MRQRVDLSELSERDILLYLVQRIGRIEANVRFSTLITIKHMSQTTEQFRQTLNKFKTVREGVKAIMQQYSEKNTCSSR